MGTVVDAAGTSAGDVAVLAGGSLPIEAHRRYTRWWGYGVSVMPGWKPNWSATIREQPRGCLTGGGVHVRPPCQQLDDRRGEGRGGSAPTPRRT